MTARDAAHAVYADVPDVACKGLCGKCCTGGIPSTDAERAEVRARGFELLPLSEGPSGKPCAALNAFGRCSVYDARPLICRLWGAAENMPCPFGCPTMLTVEEARGLVMRLVDAEGEPS